MNVEYIIIQAGGRGSRLDYLTKNKPKALVPIDNLPMLFHLFEKFPDKRFIIIGDYKINVLKKYLKTFAKVKYIVVNAAEDKGTCAGIKEAVKIVPESKSFMLIWSDLILQKDFQLPEEAGNYVGISETFPCRWKYEDERFEEEASLTYGVAGLFIFEEKGLLQEVERSGEFVRWLQGRGIPFKTLSLAGTKEYGLLESFLEAGNAICRPFNKIEFFDHHIQKEGINEFGRKLAVREKAWYQWVERKGYDNIPKIDSYEPFIMERIKGKNIYEYQLSRQEKENLLHKLIEFIDELHGLGEVDTDYFSLQEAYYTKTLDRLDSIRELLPFSHMERIMINGRLCRNVFYHREELEKMLQSLSSDNFTFIHGDCTFSNIMLRNDQTPVFIDPRGYFGFTELFGDPLYDWAKLFYSIVGNYDQFNRKKFRLEIDEDGVNLSIESNQWEELEEEFFRLLETKAGKKEIRLIHAIIWLSLTTYAWEDYDSICGAFYNGLYYLEDLWDE